MALSVVLKNMAVIDIINGVSDLSYSEICFALLKHRKFAFGLGHVWLNLFGGIFTIT